MRDKYEGLTSDGMIRTGVQRDRVPPSFEPILVAALEYIAQHSTGNGGSLPVSVFLYGSVATGAALSPSSDVDLLTIGLQRQTADACALDLSARFAAHSRSVGIAAAEKEDFEGETDSAYGGRVFLRHYCLHLLGPDPRGTESFRGDSRAARGFNGDIGLHLAAWRRSLFEEEPARLANRIARKSLLAVAGIVSVRDRIWTTDRDYSALRWAEFNPSLHPALQKLMVWVINYKGTQRSEVADVLAPGGVIEKVVDEFRSTIGLWD